MTTVLCTLYNSLYLDKGLVLYDSLCECAKDFKLYVLCMDEKCYEVLKNMNQGNHIPVRLLDLEEGDKELLAVKSNRSVGEYCWTCTSAFIRYVMNTFGHDNCTYVDADMYFYADPQILLDEMLAAGKSAIVVPHRFPDGKEKLAAQVGKYCVEFNSFMNNKEGLDALDYWRNRCLDSVARLDDGVHWGDQKYLDELVEKFECVHVCDNPGAGVAPWNLSLYEAVEKCSVIKFKSNKTQIPIIFFHYQSISYISRKVISTGIAKASMFDRKLLELYYKPYLRQIDKKKELLRSKYGLDLLMQGHPAGKHLFNNIKKTWIGQQLLVVYKKINGNRIIISI